MANSARIDELRKRFDENPRRYFAPLANEYRKSGDLAQAIFILEEYLPQQQGHISGHIVYGQTLFELGRDEEAKRVFETALSLDPENLIALRHLGHISRQAGEFEAARSWYQRLLEADPRDAEIEQLLGSLDSAAQAQAAAMAHPVANDAVSPPVPRPSADEVDHSPLQVEHLQEHDAPGASPRASTHPLGPPPLSTPFAPSSVEDETTSPPLPVAEAAFDQTHVSRPPEPEPEPVHELLDLNDFSFGAPAETRSDAAAEIAHDGASAHEASADAITDEFEIPAGHAESIAASESEAPTSESAPQSTAEVEESADSIPADVPVGFEPFSGLESRATEKETDPVGGLETYTFEAPPEPIPEATDDVTSFYLEGSYETPAEPVEPADGFESVAMEFAQDATVGASQDEASGSHESRGSGEQPVEAHGREELDDRVDRDEIDERLDAEEQEVVAEATIPAASTPVSAKSAETLPDAESDAFATETMAKLYMNQGHLESALGIYRTLAARRPDDVSLRQQIEEIEDRVHRRRREPTPPMPVAATPQLPNAAIEEVAPARPSGPTIRDFLLGIIRRGVPEVPPASPIGGTIDALFGTGAALDDDLVAADTLAEAFSPEPLVDPMNGKPAREASSELSLDSVFRQPSAAHAGERASGGFSFDQFFAGERSDDLGAPAAPGDPDDIEQFNAWLNGLKKS